MTKADSRDEILALAARLEDYGLTLEQNVVICDRRTVDEAAAALRAHAAKDNDDAS